MEEEIVRVDSQGRIIIPVSIRRNLGIRSGASLRIKIYGSKIILEPISDENLKERIKEWADTTQRVKAEVGSGEVEKSWKWISCEYAKRKLGLS